MPNWNCLIDLFRIHLTVFSIDFRTPLWQLVMFWTVLHWIFITSPVILVQAYPYPYFLQFPLIENGHLKKPWNGALHCCANHPWNPKCVFAYDLTSTILFFKPLFSVKLISEPLCMLVCQIDAIHLLCYLKHCLLMSSASVYILFLSCFSNPLQPLNFTSNSFQLFSCIMSPLYCFSFCTVLNYQTCVYQPFQNMTFPYNNMSYLHISPNTRWIYISFLMAMVYYKLDFPLIYADFCTIVFRLLVCCIYVFCPVSHPRIPVTPSL